MTITTPNMSPGSISPEPTPPPSRPKSGERSLRTRLLRTLVIGFTVLLILVVAALCLISALLSTSIGSNWVIRQIEQLLNDNTAGAQSLTIGRSEGTLLWGMTLDEVRYSDGAGINPNAVSMATLQGRWNPLMLLTGQVTLDALALDGLRVRWHGAEPVVPTAAEPLARVLAQTIQTVAESVQATLSTLPFPLSLPLNRGLAITQLRASDAILDLAPDAQPLLIDTLSLGISLQESRLRLQAFELAMTAGVNPVRVSGEGQLDFTAPYPLQLTLDWEMELPLSPDSAGVLQALASAQASPSAGPTLNLTGSQNGSQNANLQLGGQLSLSGDLNTVIVSHQLSRPLDILSEGSVSTGLQSSLAAAGGLSLQHRIVSQRLPLQVGGGDASLSRAGPLPQGQGGGGGGELSLVVDEAEISSTGSLAALHLTGTTSLDVENASGERVAPTMTLNWNALLEGSTLTIDQFNASTPTGSLSSTGQLGWADGVDLNLTYSLREQDASNYQALLPEGFLPGALASTGSLTLRQSPEGSIGTFAIDSLEGILNGYPLTGGGVVALDGGDFEFSALRLNVGDNQLRASGRWSDDIALEFQLQADSLQNLSPLLAGALQASGTIAGPRSGPSLTLTATGTDIVAGAQRIDALQLDVDGQLAAHRLTLAMRSPLGEAALQLSGGFDAIDAATSGTPAAPLLWQGRLLNGTLRTELGDWQLQEAAELQLSPAQVSIAQHCWSQGTSALCLQGEWDDSAAIEASATLSGYPLSTFNSAAQAGAPSTTTTALSSLRSRLPAGTSFEGTVTAQATVSGRLTDAPEDLALDLRVDLGTGYAAFIGAAGPAGAAESSGTAGLSGAAGLSEDSGAGAPLAQEFHWQSAILTANRRDNRWLLDAGVDFVQPDLAATGISVQGSARGRLTITADQRLDGQLTLTFDDLSWVQAFARQVQISQGQLSGLATLGGTVSEPRVSGNLYLRDTALSIPAMGLQISELNTTVSSTFDPTADTGANGTLTLQGQARSGQGELVFQSEIQKPFSPERSMTLTLQGENVDLIRRPELNLAISPDVTVTASSTGVDITGLLRIPLLDIQITALPASAIDVSSDTVLVGQPDEGPTIHNAAQADRGILDNVPLTAQLRVELGEDVHFSGFGLDSHLTGALDITQRATGAPLTYGELTVVEGSYETYGRTLTIEHGKLLFFGSYDNPALDIRAVRRTENVTVGVQMNGTLRDIRSQLFSTPTLPDGDIIAVLLTDRPFAEIGAQDSNALIGAITNLGINQGQSLTNQIRNQLGLDTLAITSRGDTTSSSLTLGKYLTPRLFIRYGVGLFETESTLSIDYTLSERVKLEAKSGTTQSVDIKYTVDR
ncbi:MAG: translocation/assembly module TamB domain-containing protein [Gammaproteobacteria bacterium]|nr:translocation/assembly module TamB domain-containing protein [Gammaproteobacteria bacterium]